MGGFCPLAINCKKIDKQKQDKSGKLCYNIFMTTIRAFFWIMFIAALPVVELRLAIPAGLAMELEAVPCFVAAFIGNMLPVPFIILFTRRVFTFLRRRSGRLDKLVTGMEKRALEKAQLVRRYELIGLLILVAIPLPGTGAWTGSLIAALLDIRMKSAVPVIAAGVFIAGIIVSVISYSTISIFGFS